MRADSAISPAIEAGRLEGMGEIELGWGDFGGEAAAWGVQAPVSVSISLIGRCVVAAASRKPGSAGAWVKRGGIRDNVRRSQLPDWPQCATVGQRLRSVPSLLLLCAPRPSSPAPT